MTKNPAFDIQETRLAALYEVSSRLGQSLNLKEVLDQVMDSIIELTGAERGYIMLFDEMTGELKTMAARNVDHKTIPEGERIISRTVIERAVTSTEGVLTDNAQEDSRFSGEESVIGLQLRSILCAPLRVREKVLGAVYVDNRLSNGVFNVDDLNLLMTFANQAASAIENARLFTQTDQALARRVDELSLFQRIDQQLNQSLELEQVLSLALNWAITLTNADSGSIGLMKNVEDSNAQILELEVYRGRTDADEREFVAPDHPVLNQLLKQKHSIVSKDVTVDMAIGGKPSKLQLVVPILQDKDVAGLITLESEQRVAFKAEDVAFVERLSDRAAVAINNARLFDDIQKANQAKSDFISLVTHELRLPMTSIKGYTDLMNSGMAGPLNEQQGQFLEVIRRNLQRMNALISDLADINRVESGRMRFEMSDFDLGQTVDDVVDSFREPIESRKQRIAVEISDELLPVHADPQRVGQILTNLVSNAHKYTLDGGTILVQVKNDNEQFAKISVIDSGLGISEEDQQKLFSQFFRSEDAEVRAQQGWGLGLSIVRRMVEAQGGTIDFRSTLGQGSTFWFTIPLAIASQHLGDA